MLPFTGWLENTALSQWVRESPSLLAFPFILIVHAWGMALLAGANAALDLRILGLASRIPLSAMEKFYPVMWFGFLINAVSGVLLLIGYPTKALTNPVFYLKLGCIAIGMVLMVWQRNRVIRADKWIPGQGRWVAVLSLLAWSAGIVGGRLLAYTYRYLMADFQ